MCKQYVNEQCYHYVTSIFNLQDSNHTLLRMIVIVLLYPIDNANIKRKFELSSYIAFIFIL